MRRGRHHAGARLTSNFWAVNGLPGSEEEHMSGGVRCDHGGDQGNTAAGSPRLVLDGNLELECWSRAAFLRGFIQ
ncbi:hypothetical protein E2C01_015147 [Portunus trituberculatus]|uniref:Uncharacterized protein n=1 Tax=Portunus trituberculatus TaxID=210409 RepID=A0A5B7DKJ1_PORTR|nr:hypothetical protein [Portunus trituberculatus]